MIGSSFMPPSAICCLQRFEREAAALGAERLVLGLLLAERRDLPRLGRVGHRLERVAGLRQARRGRALRPASPGRRCFDRLAAIVDQRADLADDRCRR